MVSSSFRPLVFSSLPLEESPFSLLEDEMARLLLSGIVARAKPLPDLTRLMCLVLAIYRAGVTIFWKENILNEKRVLHEIDYEHFEINFSTAHAVQVAVHAAKLTKLMFQGKQLCKLVLIPAL